MNMQNLLAQLQNATNPTQMLMGVLTGNQKQTMKQFQSKNRQQQCQAIADKANQLGLKKEDLQNIINMLNGKK